MAKLRHTWTPQRRRPTFRLAKTMFRDQFPTMYTRSSWRRTLALFLMVLMTVGLSLSLVKASDMAVKMGMMSGMDMSDGGCGGCPDKVSDGKGVAACPTMCVVPVAALPPLIPSTEIAVSLPTLSPPLYPALHGRHAPPDPYPPRANDLA
jgi:hypothetical protein